MGQVDSHFRGTGFNSSAELNRELVEFQLIEEFGWLPQDIAKIPYIWLQKFFLIRRQKSVTLQQKAEREAKKSVAAKKINRR